MRKLDCPACKLPMQQFFAEAGDGGLRVELDRCPKCTRLWFDVRELERAVGKAFLPRMRGSDAAHSCPACTLLLGTCLIRGEVAIEECSHCGGAFLDASEFELISGKPLAEAAKAKAKAPPPSPAAKPAPKPAPPPPNKPKLVEFTCERCRNRTPVKDAGNRLGATVCRKCELEPWPDQPNWYPKASRGSDDLTEFLDDIVDNLFNR